MNLCDYDRLTERLLQQVRGTDPDFLTRWLHVLKDMLLDWDLTSERDEPAPAPPELPPMSVDAFIVLMRGKMEDSLRQVAEAINAAPTGNLIASSEQQVCRLLADLWTTALETGVQLRIDTAVAGPTPLPPPAGIWAARLRRMQGAGPGMPVTSTPSETV